MPLNTLFIIFVIYHLPHVLSQTRKHCVTRLDVYNRVACEGSHVLRVLWFMNVPSHSDSLLLERRKAALTAISPIELLFGLSHLRHGECLILRQKGILEADLSLAHFPQLIA